MKFTDKTSIRLLKRLDCSELTESIRTLPEDEAKGQADIDILRQELDYIIELYEEDGTLFSEDLEISKRIMRETRNGKTMPCRITEGHQIRFIYTPAQVQNAKRTINEYRRLKRIRKEI